MGPTTVTEGWTRHWERPYVINGREWQGGWVGGLAA